MANVCIAVPAASLAFEASVEPTVYDVIADVVKYVWHRTGASFTVVEAQSMFTFTGRQRAVRGIGASIEGALCSLFCGLKEQ